MKLKCIASREEWFVVGREFRTDEFCVFDLERGRWRPVHYGRGIWVVGSVAVFQEVEE